MGQPSASVGAGHGSRSEDACHLPSHPAGPGVRDGADGAGDAYDEQRCGDGLLGIHPGDIGQQRDGEDRSTAAEQAQRDPDEDGENDGECDHGNLMMAYPWGYMQEWWR